MQALHIILSMLVFVDILSFIAPYTTSNMRELHWWYIAEGNVYTLKYMILRQSILSTDKIMEMWKRENFLSSLAPLARIFIEFSQC